MTERKPPGVKWETFVERQIREGMKSGAFDGLPGHGKPIASLDQPYDEEWWLREKLRREEIVSLPPVLALRRDVDEVKAAILLTETEDEVRTMVADLNKRIVALNSKAHSGPPSTLMPLNIEAVLARWTQERAAQPTRPRE